MNAWSRERFLQVTETEIKGRDLVALLGRDIRTAHEVIAEYCVTQHLPVYEDLPFADEWWFRSTHPGFVRRWSRVLSRILDAPIQFEQPNLWSTKGEVLSRLRENDLTKDWELTSSCSARPADRYGHKGCGICGGCLLRIVSALSASLPIAPSQFACDIRGMAAIIRDHSGSTRNMPSSYRNVAVRAISAMEGFARLLDSPLGPSTIWREAAQTDENSPEQVQRHLVELLKRHRCEWDAFLHSLPSGSWVHDIVDQL